MLVVAGPVWPAVEITYKVSIVVKTLTVWQVTNAAKTAVESIESFILKLYNVKNIGKERTAFLKGTWDPL